MGFFRSADMDLYEVSIPKDNVWEIMDAFGSLDSLHFIDLNKDEQVFTLVYASRIKRCDEALRKITTVIEAEANRMKLPMMLPADLNALQSVIKKQSRFRQRSPQVIFDLVEEEINKQSRLIDDQQAREEQMHAQCLAYIEQRAILTVAAKVLNKDNEAGENDEENKFDIRMREGDQQLEAREELIYKGGLKIAHIAGAINQSEKERLQKLIFRSTRGTAMTYFQDIEQPFIDYKGIKGYKTVYLIIYQEGEYYREKLIRILDSFLCSKIEIEDINFKEQINEATRKIDEIRKTMISCFDQIKGYVRAINSLEGSNLSKIQLYKLYLIKEKCLYENLNKMKLGRKFFVGVFWLPSSEISSIQDTIQKLQDKKQIRNPQINKRRDHSLTPPTFIRTNEFTYAFQEITNTYGVPCYKEVNPSYFGVITFPFLFGVMFGDIGHGTLLFLFGVFLCLLESCLRQGSLKQFMPYRYLILMMGFFAMFCGWCYNDMMSIPVEKFNSCIEFDDDDTVGEFKDDCVYPFGVDPYWYLSSNNLTYLNSLKMKISVILGVAQMCLGIFMKAINSLYFKRMLDFYYEFIPQLILMLCLFGWMDFLIIVKWLTPWEGNTSRAPGIVSIMISMFLNFGEIDTDTTDALIVSPDVQQNICITLLILALFCIPAMLFTKPYFIYKDMKKHYKVHNESGEYVELLDKPSVEENEELIGKNANIHHEINVTRILNSETVDESHGFGEIFIHQLIETIEFALGTVSNTASYLRLWALSLAHGQLADVFFEKLLHSLGLSGAGNGVILFFCFPVFASFSFFVLMCMDSMECFLHTLRLHWVEFQNKFYKGNGYKFVPFSFQEKISEVINNNVAPNITVAEPENPRVDDSDDSIQELQPTIDQVKKLTKEEDDKKKEDESTKAEIELKNKLFNDIRKAQRQINIDSLKDARERLENLRKALQTKKALLLSVNITDEDPEEIYNPKMNFDENFNSLTTGQSEQDLEICSVERLIAQIGNLSNDRDGLNNYTVHELEDMLAKCKEINLKVANVFKSLDTISAEQAGSFDNLDRFLEEAKPEQINR